MHILERENNTVQDDELHTNHHHIRIETQFSINDDGRIVARRYLPDAEQKLTEAKERLEEMKADEAGEYEIDQQEDRIETLEEWQTERLVVFDKEESRSLRRFIKNHA